MSLWGVDVFVADSLLRKVLPPEAIKGKSARIVRGCAAREPKAVQGHQLALIQYQLIESTLKLLWCVRARKLFNGGL